MLFIVLRTLSGLQRTMTFIVGPPLVFSGFRFTAALFKGDGYIFYMDPAYNDSDVRKSYISFNFSTTALSGLILWNGQVRHHVTSGMPRSWGHGVIQH